MLAVGDMRPVRRLCRFRWDQRFESAFLHRRVCKPSVPRNVRVTPEHSSEGRPSLLRAIGHTAENKRPGATKTPGWATRRIPPAEGGPESFSRIAMTEHAEERLRSISLGGGPSMPKEAKPIQVDPIDVTRARQQQHTGNHDKPGPERGGSDRHGGTRHGAEN